MKPGGYILIGTGAAVVSAAAAASMWVASPFRWSGQIDARLKGVEDSTVRIETKVDQILLQRGQK